MANENIKKLMFLDPSKTNEIIDFYEGFQYGEDLHYLGEKQRQELKTPTYTFDEKQFDIENPDAEEYNNCVHEYNSFHTNMKYFLLARAIMENDDKTYLYKIESRGLSRRGQNKIIEDLTEAKKLEKGGKELTQEEEDEIALNSKACLIANALMEHPDQFGDLDSHGMFKKLIQDAVKKDKDFLKKAYNVNNVLANMHPGDIMYMDTAMSHTSKEELDYVRENYFNAGQYSNKINDYLNNKEEFKQNERATRERERIRQMQERRNNRNPLWFVFRFVSNIIDYVKLNKAKSNYIRDFIDPKATARNGYLDQEEKQRLINKFNEDINSEEPLIREVPKNNIQLDQTKLQSDLVTSINNPLKSQELSKGMQEKNLDDSQIQIDNQGPQLKQ